MSGSSSLSGREWMPGTKNPVSEKRPMTSAPTSVEIEVAGARPVGVEGGAVLPAPTGDGAAAQHHGRAGRNRLADRCDRTPRSAPRRRRTRARTTLARFSASVRPPWIDAALAHVVGHALHLGGTMEGRLAAEPSIARLGSLELLT